MKMKWVLDVNVLFDALNEFRPKHRTAKQWLSGARSEGWGVPPETFLGTIRLLMNPTVMAGCPLKINAILEMLYGEISPANGGHLLAGIKPSGAFLKKIQGHRQVTDFYLVNTAFEYEAVLVTTDAGLHAEWPKLTKLI